MRVKLAEQKTKIAIWKMLSKCWTTTQWLVCF